MTELKRKKPRWLPWTAIVLTVIGALVLQFTRWGAIPLYTGLILMIIGIWG